MERKILDSGKLADAIKTLNGWSVEAKILKKRFTFANFAESLEFVNRVGALAEVADHHPDVTFGWGYAEIAFTTHDRGGITAVDVDAALKIDQIA